MDLYKTLFNQLKKNQSPQRFRHSVNVGNLSAELAEQYEGDPDRARLTGLLHDWAKEWKPTELINYVKKHRLQIPSKDFIVEASPNHLHAYVGADLTRRKKWLTDDEAEAVASHTFGSLEMSKLQKIVFIADFTSHDRLYRSAKKIRQLAMKDLDKGFEAAVAQKMKFHLKKRKALHPVTHYMWHKVVCKTKTGHGR